MTLQGDRAATARSRAAWVLAVGGAVLALPVAHYLAGRDSGFLYPLGFEGGLSGSPASWLLALGVAVAFTVFSISRIPPVRDTWREVTPLKLLAIVAAVPAAIVEEAFFRRLVMDAAGRAGAGDAAQALVSAAAFGIAHASWGLFRGNVGIALRAAVATGALGLALAGVYVVAGRSLAPCIAAHFLVTAALEPGLLIAATSGRFR